MTTVVTENFIVFIIYREFDKPTENNMNPQNINAVCNTTQTDETCKYSTLNHAYLAFCLSKNGFAYVLKNSASLHNIKFINGMSGSILFTWISFFV